MNFQRAAIHLKFLAGRYRRNRPAYARFRDWVSCLYSDAVDLSPIPLRGGVRQVRCPQLGRSVELRLGTSDWFTFEEIFQHHEYQPMIEHMEIAPHVALDLGANIGLSVALWRKTWPLAHVVGVEPDGGNLAQARKNMGGDGELVQALVGGCSRQAYLNRSAACAAYSLSDDPLGGEPVAVRTVPELLPGSGAIDLVKCDIEGAEAEVFGDCAAWIGRVRHLVVEVHPPYSREKLLEDLRRARSPLAVFHAVEKAGVEVLFLCGGGCGSGAVG